MFQLHLIWHNFNSDSLKCVAALNILMITEWLMKNFRWVYAALWRAGVVLVARGRAFGFTFSHAIVATWFTLTVFWAWVRHCLKISITSGSRTATNINKTSFYRIRANSSVDIRRRRQRRRRSQHRSTTQQESSSNDSKPRAMT